MNYPSRIGTFDFADYDDVGFRAALGLELPGSSLLTAVDASQHYRACACAACCGDKSVGAQGSTVTAGGIDIPGDSSTTATITVGGSVVDELETVGDTDWYRITLSGNQTILISLNGSGATPVSDTYLRIYNANGVLIAENDDGGGGLNSLLRFTAANPGTYYIEVDSYSSSYTGQYTLSVEEAPPLEVFSVDQIADQLTAGYWGGGERSFNVGADGSLTVNFSSLTSAEQSLVTQALALWTDVTGINFVSVTSNAEITFQNTEDGAYAESSRNGSTITSSTVNVSSQWVNDYGTSLDSYTFSTYIHEIGHALGLGHAGNYNGSASYANDALYLNDSIATTIMSYFSQTENSYFSQQGFSFAETTSPMIADIVAITNLYGFSTNTRLGNTTYGFNSNSNRAIHNANQFANTSYTIVDSGGVDTLDYSGFSANQLINLNPEMFMNIGGLTGNVTIGRGTVIENATGGSGADMIIGNDVVNVLRGNGGNDTIDGGIGSDWLYGGNGDDAIEGGQGWDQIFGGDGRDTISGGIGNDTISGELGRDTIEGGAGNDVLRGNGGDDVVSGGDGDDIIRGNWANDLLLGGYGDDVIYGGHGIDTIRGYVGNDTLYGEDGDDDINGSGGNDEIYGGAGNDMLRGESGADTIVGGAGDDWIDGGFGNDILTGGGGNDVFVLSVFGVENIDTITDLAAGDRFGLDRSALFGSIEDEGQLAASAFRYGTEAQDADDRILYNFSTGEIFYDQDGIGGSDAVLVAQIAARTTISAGWFFAFGEALPPPFFAPPPPKVDLASHADTMVF